MKAAIVQDLAEEVLLGRDVPLHKHMVKRLPKGEQMELLRQLTRDNKVQLKEKPEDDEKAQAVVTRVQERRMAQQRKVAVETCEQNPEEEDTVGMQEDNPDTRGGDPTEGQGSREEIAVDKDCLLGIEFLFDEELFEKPRKLRAHLT